MCAWCSGMVTVLISPCLCICVWLWLFQAQWFSEGSSLGLSKSFLLTLLPREEVLLLLVQSLSAPSPRWTPEPAYMFFLICIFRSSKYCFCSPCLQYVKCWFCVSPNSCCYTLSWENYSLMFLSYCRKLAKHYESFGKGMVSIILFDLKCLYPIIICNNLNEGFY